MEMAPRFTISSQSLAREASQGIKHTIPGLQGHWPDDYATETSSMMLAIA